MTAGYATEIEYTGHETVCDMINIVWEWSTTVGYILTLAIIVFLPYKVYEQFKGDPFPRLSRPMCFCVAIESLFIFVVLVFPFTFVLPWASFGQKPDDNCTKFNSVVVSIINFIDLGGTFVIIIALSVVFCCLACKYRETRATLCRTLIFIGFYVAYIVIALGFSIGTIYKFDASGNGINSVQLPVLQLILPLGFLFYIYSFNLFHWRAIKRAMSEWRCFRSCCRRENAPQGDQLREATTAPRSHRMTAPSCNLL